MSLREIPESRTIRASLSETYIRAEDHNGEFEGEIYLRVEDHDGEFEGEVPQSQGP